MRSKADRLAKKYGYKEVYEDGWLIYKKKLENGEVLRIIFLENVHKLAFDILYYGVVYEAIGKIDVQAVQLAYTKCKELGWLND